MKSPLIKLNSGYEIPLVGFGTYKLTKQEDIDKAVDSALECGYRLFDTAKLYQNEALLGNAFEVFFGTLFLIHSTILKFGVDIHKDKN